MLEDFEKKVYSQNGEDGIIEYIFTAIGTTNKYAIEFGATDGITNSNIHNLHLHEWQMLQLDKVQCKTNKPVYIETITPNNIEAIFDKYNVPKTFDLLSIDIDGNDFYVWKALVNYRPRVVVIEYNGFYDDNRLLPYDENAYYGCSSATINALCKLAEEKSYRLVYTEKTGVNAFFVDSSIDFQCEVQTLKKKATWRKDSPYKVNNWLKY